MERMILNKAYKQLEFMLEDLQAGCALMVLFFLMKSYMLHKGDNCVGGQCLIFIIV